MSDFPQILSDWHQMGQIRVFLKVSFLFILAHQALKKSHICPAWCHSDHIWGQIWHPWTRWWRHQSFQVKWDAVAQWWDHLLEVRKFPGSNIVRTSSVHPAVKGYPISDRARYCQIACLWAPKRQPECIFPRKLKWFQIDTWSIGVIISVKAL